MNIKSRRKKSGNKTIAIIATLLVHALIIGALFFNFTREPSKVIEAEYAEKVDTVKATVVDAADIQQERDKIKKQELEKKRKQELEKKRLKELQNQAELEQKKLEELKEAREKEAELAETQRKEIALKREQEEAKRKKEEAEKEKAAREKAEREKAEKERKEAELKKQQKLQEQAAAAEAQRQLEQQMAAEEAFQAEKKAKERAATLIGKYAGLIKQKVNRYWAVLPGLPANLTTKVNVKLSSSGDVKSATIVQSSGYAQFDRQVISAVLKATPLPIPSKSDDELVNKEFQDLTLSFP